eukprot:TRINITY_DN3729_c1_g1_i2.p1 TRINITY_DN3729_c1_g1~~TRINITY_DN3729_c1_g1_i2.p1  ORF type:complete len:255 (+),score=63.42 TRINITY_DN3729_c1_g1_i2:66-767(+)
MAETQSIRYAAVYNGAQLVGEYPRKEYPRYAESVAFIARRESRSPQYKRSCEVDSATSTHVNYYSTGDGRLYGCVTTPQLEVRRTWGLLAKLEATLRREQSEQRVDGGSDVLLLPLRRPPARPRHQVLKAETAFFNDPSNDPMLHAQQLTGELKDSMLEVFDELVRRGDRISQMALDTDELERQAAEFKTHAREVRRNACWEDYKTRVILAAVVAVMLLFLLMAVCKPNFSDC